MSTDDRTDSETAFDEVVYPAIEDYGWNSPEANEVVTDLCKHGSKIAMMYNGDVLMYGDFIRDEDGCYYSNHRFMNYCKPFIPSQI